ncbi:MAG: hypothetical protein H0W39_05685 [Sphingomonas sp.]|nr:hypothetical protein [Sphingomonas sp.]
MRQTVFAAAAAFALSICAPAASQATVETNLDQYPAISGTWLYRPFAGGSESLFRDGAQAQRLAIRCNRATRVVSIVRSAVPAAAPTLSIWTSSMARSLPSRFDAARNLSADLNARDPLLDAIAYSRGRFATAAAGAPMATIPTSPEAVRVIEDCRS